MHVATSALLPRKSPSSGTLHLATSFGVPVFSEDHALSPDKNHQSQTKRTVRATVSAPTRVHTAILVHASSTVIALRLCNIVGVGTRATKDLKRRSSPSLSAAIQSSGDTKDWKRRWSKSLSAEIQSSGDGVRTHILPSENKVRSGARGCSRQRVSCSDSRQRTV